MGSVVLLERSHVCKIGQRISGVCRMKGSEEIRKMNGRDDKKG